MVSLVRIFERGGAVIWSSNDDEGTDAINSLIRERLLTDHSGNDDSFISNDHAVKFTYANNFNLIFVAVYASFQKLLYVDDLLKAIKHEFLKMFHNTLNGGLTNLTMHSFNQFDEKFLKILNYYAKNNNNKNKGAKSWHDTQKGKEYKLRTFNNNGSSNNNINKESKKGSSTDGGASGSGSGTGTGGAANGGGGGDTDTDGSAAATPRGGDDIDDEFAKMRRIKSSGPRSFQPRNKKNGKNKNNKGGKKGGTNDSNSNKKMRDWSALGGTSKKKLSAKDIANLNLSSTDIFSKSNNDSSNIDSDHERESHKNRNVDLESSDDDDDDDTDGYVPDFDDEKNGETNGNSSKSKSIWSRFANLITDKPLTKEDLSPVLKEFETLLSSKNVANSIAVDLCSSVESSLIGKQIGTFGSIRNTVITTLTEALERILTPTHPVNILHGISTAREQQRPYTIVFIGVNGVGKSTTLAKVIHYLKTRNLKVSVAACDTFRSGAVEQLKTHCVALNVRLFDQGYAKDAANVAMSAIKEASNKYYDDVVLIDTAGRMQNNEPLMRSLVNLISKNRPDLVLFVGEALVGNDGVDQLIEFNKALKNLTNSKNPRLIDGIILTKFDAVDDKVGAAISMTYRSGKPIVFLGTGQTYGDLKRAHVKTLINKLLQ